MAEASSQVELQELQASQPKDAASAPDGWGQHISPERQVELQAILAAWSALDADHGERKSPFDGISLTGADACWLAEQSGRNVFGEMPNFHLEGAVLDEAHLEGADLHAAYLEGAVLDAAHLEGADLSWAHLEGASLGEAHLEGANLSYANLEGASLGEAHLEGADLHAATLDEKTDFTDAIIFEAEDTRPLRIRLLRRPRYGPALGDIHWGSFDQVQLIQLRGWESMQRLADERDVSWESDVDEHRNVVRAYRQVAQRLRDQGYSDIADRMADRAQVRQRKLLFSQMLEDWRRPWRLPGDLLRWLFSWFLALLAGYGYHPGRSVFWYLAVITGFAVAYFRVTHSLPVFLLPPSQFGKSFDWTQAFVLSFSAFHGRGFFNPPGDLGDSIAILATAEAVFGLLIEISFIATFTQRFFGSK